MSERVILLFENKKAPLHFKTKSDYQNAPVWVKHFTKACMKTCTGEIAAYLGGCKDFLKAERETLWHADDQAHAMDIRQKMLESITRNHAQSYHYLEEAARAFRKPPDQVHVLKENGLEEERVPRPSVCAMRFLTRFSKISKFCAIEIMNKVVPVIEGAFKYGDSFNKTQMDGPLHELRHAIEGMMKQNVEEDADEERNRSIIAEKDVENVDPYIKKVKTEPVEIDDEEILKVKPNKLCRGSNVATETSCTL